MADMGPRDVLTVIFMPVVRSISVLAQRLSLYRFVMLWLDLPM